MSTWCIFSILFFKAHKWYHLLQNAMYFRQLTGLLSLLWIRVRKISKLSAFCCVFLCIYIDRWSILIGWVNLTRLTCKSKTGRSWLHFISSEHSQIQESTWTWKLKSLVISRFHLWPPWALKRYNEIEHKIWIL